MTPPRKKQPSAKAATPAPKKRARKPGDTHVDTKTAVSPALGQARERIDSIDQHIQELIAERANWAQQVGRARGQPKDAIGARSAESRVGKEGGSTRRSRGDA